MYPVHEAVWSEVTHDDGRRVRGGLRGDDSVYCRGVLWWFASNGRWRQRECWLDGRVCPECIVARGVGASLAWKSAVHEGVK